MASSRAKTRSTQSQQCEKYRGILICIKRNTDVNTGDIKKNAIFLSKYVVFDDVTFNFFKNNVFCH